MTWAVGTGPFKFESWTQGDNVTLARNPDHWNKTLKTNADKIVFKTIKDPSALKTAFMNKEVDLIMNVVPLDAREIEKQGAKILTTNGYFGYHYLAFNMNSPRVGQVKPDGSPDIDGEYDLKANSAKLRMAILYSINPSDIVNSPDIMDKRGIVTLQYVETLPFGHITDPGRHAHGRGQRADRLLQPRRRPGRSSTRCRPRSSSPARSSAPPCRAASTSRKPWSSRTRSRRPSASTWSRSSRWPSRSWPRAAATPIPRCGTSW